MTLSLADALRPEAPGAAAAAAGAGRLADWRALLGPAHPLGPLLDRPAVAALLGSLAGHSPYLWRLATADPDGLADLLRASPAASLDAILAGLDWAGETQAAVMAGLRRGKARCALLVAMADIGRAWDLDRVTGALTAFADGALRAALRFLLAEAHGRGRLRLPDPRDPEKGCGLVVLALGKQGGGELNYSSDIDVVVYFDPATAPVPEGSAPAPVYVKLTQTLARMLSDRTAEGYCLRVDLRLRPDPGSTAVAIGLPSAFSYYERYGQNWERAALIKARPVAGELALGDAFLRELTPFVWRRYFDYAALADVAAMKRQIHAVRGHGRIAVAGHDVKLGRGGIREIEFFAQTQQLIFGGRRPHLRGRRTLPTLEALWRDGWVDEAAVRELSAAYVFLRGVEHRLQMVADEQTQTLPEGEALEGFARFAGYSDAGAFAAAFTGHARAVEAHYARLFEHAPGLDAENGSLVFTGVENDPDTLATLRRLGFARPEGAAELVRGWHFGRRAAVQSPRAREVLTELVPPLIAAFARGSDPDAAIAAFDAMLGRLPAAVELLSMLRANAALLELFGDILGLAPRLAATVASRPHVLDAAIDPASLAAAADPGALEARVAAALDPTLPAEEFLDRARDLAGEEMFAVGVRLLAGTETPARAGQAYADLAAAVIRASLGQVTASFEAAHGRVPGGACVVVAMGRLGSREMTAGSDLDLLLIYDADPGGDSDGARPLDASRYYARLTQRLIGALTLPTRRGRLYEVDMRLRPSGNQGPLATRLASFLDYQRHEAATWEHMALTRARVVAGDPGLAARVEAAITGVLTAPREPGPTLAAVAAMRALVAREKGEADPWDLKRAAGGLVDIEFIAQSLVLVHAARHPDLAVPDGTAAVLGRAARHGVLPQEEARLLGDAYALLTALLQITRLASPGRFDPAGAGTGLRRRLAAVAGLPDFAGLQAELAERQRGVRAVFLRRVGWPAGD